MRTYRANALHSHKYVWDQTRKISILYRQVREKGKKPPTTHHTQEKVKLLCEEMMAFCEADIVAYWLV